MSNQFNNPKGRGGNEVRISFADLHRIFHDRLEYMGANPDIDAVCQQACVEIEKTMGTYPNIPTSTPSAVSVMKEALEWYAEQLSHVRKNHQEGVDARQQLTNDCGKRAEVALAKVKELRHE